MKLFEILFAIILAPINILLFTYFFIETLIKKQKNESSSRDNIRD